MQEFVSLFVFVLLQLACILTIVRWHGMPKDHIFSSVG